jgi:hypothetical protein
MLHLAGRIATRGCVGRCMRPAPRTIRNKSNVQRATPRRVWSVQNRWGVRYLSRADVVLLSCGLGFSQDVLLYLFWLSGEPPHPRASGRTPPRQVIPRCDFLGPLGFFAGELAAFRDAALDEHAPSCVISCTRLHRRHIWECSLNITLGTRYFLSDNRNRIP